MAPPLVLAILSSLLLTGCYKNHLYVQQEWIDRNYLASSQVGTPDPRQACPPQGQRLLVSWKYPKVLLDEQLQLQITVRFWDNSEEVICHPVDRSWGSASFFFSETKILTYKIDVVNQCNEIIETWQHHFWTELIDIDRSSSSVSSQSRQGSVIEIP